MHALLSSTDFIFWSETRLCPGIVSEYFPTVSRSLVMLTNAFSLFMPHAVIIACVQIQKSTFHIRVLKIMRPEDRGLSLVIIIIIITIRLGVIIIINTYGF